MSTVSKYSVYRPGRQTGRTAFQMQMAPPGAVFVWCTSDISYPKHLARSLGREDLQIWPSAKLDERYIRGQGFSGFVIDHAHPIGTPKEWDACEIAKLCTRKPPEDPNK
jgi:hypothetical protein